MTAFETYYKTRFQADLEQFFSNIPIQSKFHEDERNREIHSIQIGRLTNKYDHLNFMTNDQKINFGVSLFFLVLIDEVFYTHYKYEYPWFQQLTKYPKYIGNCLMGCYYHPHPRSIFSAMNVMNLYKDKSTHQDLDFETAFHEAISIMESETKELLNNHFPDIDFSIFWKYCEDEFPYSKT